MKISKLQSSHKKIISLLGVASASILIGLPVLAQVEPTGDVTGNSADVLESEPPVDALESKPTADMAETDTAIEAEPTADAMETEAPTEAEPATDALEAEAPADVEPSADAVETEPSVDAGPSADVMETDEPMADPAATEPSVDELETGVPADAEPSVAEPSVDELETGVPADAEPSVDEPPADTLDAEPPVDTTEPSAQPDEPTSEVPDAGEDSLASVAADNESLNTFTIALEAAGLTETFSQEGPMTVFAPSDEAFEALPDGLMEQLLSDQETLTRILAYHVIAGDVTSDQIQSGAVPTAEGNPIEVQAGTDAITVNGASVVEADLEAENGVMHIIDEVILPPNL